MKNCIEQDHHEMEKPIDFWLRKGKAVGETKPTENFRDPPKNSTISTKTKKHNIMTHINFLSNLAVGNRVNLEK